MQNEYQFREKLLRYLSHGRDVFFLSIKIHHEIFEVDVHMHVHVPSNHLIDKNGKHIIQWETY